MDFKKGDKVTWGNRPHEWGFIESCVAAGEGNESTDHNFPFKFDKGERICDITTPNIPLEFSVVPKSKLRSA